MMIKNQQQQQGRTHQRSEAQDSAIRMSPLLKKFRGRPSLVGSVHVRARSYQQMAEECWASPVSDDEVSPEVKVQYDAITDSILSIPWTSGMVAIRKYFQELVSCIQINAAIHPTLARVVARDMHQRSMLTLLCEKAHTPLAHPTMKFLIESNPSALLWKRDDWEKMGIEYSMPIYTIANHHAHHVLLPWIAEHYPWVLEHPACQARPPTFDFIAQCINGVALNSNVVRQYFSKYPQALRHMDPSQNTTPLHHFLSGFTECKLDLFQWLVTQCPSALVQQNALGWTPLHAACLALTESLSKNMKEICMFIIQLAPQSVHMAAFDGTLPIHILQNRHNKPNIQRILLTLLRTYPESYSVTTKDPSSYPAPSSHQFVKKVMPLILEERELEGTITHLLKMPANLTMALGDQGSVSLACKVFARWSKSNLTSSEGRLKWIAAELEAICKAEGEARDRSPLASFYSLGATETEVGSITISRYDDDDFDYQFQ